ncbi:MAG: hypothetical protein P4K78_03495, partial [Terracidiphilus sp.]|nr:hypothetical protein [Terracidiphilus sp.]
MKCSGSPVQRRLLVRCMVATILTVVFAFVAAGVFRLFHPHGVVAYLVAILPALPIVGLLIALGIYLTEEKDEFQRRLQVEYLLWGIGGTLSVTTVWGYLEDFARAPRLDLIWIYPIFWLFVGIAMPVVNRRY